MATSRLKPTKPWSSARSGFRLSEDLDQLFRALLLGALVEGPNKPGVETVAMRSVRAYRGFLGRFGGLPGGTGLLARLGLRGRNVDATWRSTGLLGGFRWLPSCCGLGRFLFFKESVSFRCCPLAVITAVTTSITLVWHTSKQILRTIGKGDGTAMGTPGSPKRAQE